MSSRELSDREQDLVLALVDGSLAAEQRAEAEAEVLALPGGREALERQRRVAALVRGGPFAPEWLRGRIEGQIASSERAGWLRPPVLKVALGGAVAATVLIALAVVLSVGGGGPSVAQAAELGARPATEATPAAAGGKPALLDKTFEGVAFPNWTETFGWRADGARSDGLEGRQAETVFYTHQGHRIGYTVVSGEPLEPPEQARGVSKNGVEILLYKEGPRDVAVFERDGQTCILSGRVLRQSTLVKLAAWKGGGSVGFSGAGEHRH